MLRVGSADVVPDDWPTVDDQTWPTSLAGGHHLGHRAHEHIVSRQANREPAAEAAYRQRTGLGLPIE